jgi:dipicolinate synthase subunit A
MYLLTQRDIHCYDYMQSEEISLYNSIATGEGILAEAIANYPYNLHKSNCLVIGYGRCGRTLADKLKGLGAHVTICARKPQVLSSADCLGYEGISMEHLEDMIQNYQLIFNTAPHPVLTREILEHLTPCSQIYDLASPPGGIDKNGADVLGLTTFSCLGLPGKYAPAASADALYDYILETLKNNTKIKKGS